MGVERDTQRHKMTHRDTEREMHEPAKLVSPHTHTHTHTHKHPHTNTNTHLPHLHERFGQLQSGDDLAAIHSEKVRAW